MTPEDRLLILQRGLDSDFWRLFVARWQPTLDRLLGKTITHLEDENPFVRDRRCERAAAIQEMLDWPKQQVESILKSLRTKTDEEAN